MKQIFKYPITLSDIQFVDLPEGAEILTIAQQKDDVFLWAKIDPSHKTVPRRITCVGTGHEIDGDVDDIHLASLQFNDGKFIFHYFERPGEYRA